LNGRVLAVCFAAFQSNRPYYLRALFRTGCRPAIRTVAARRRTPPDRRNSIEGGYTQKAVESNRPRHAVSWLGVGGRGDEKRSTVPRSHGWPEPTPSDGATEGHCTDTAAVIAGTAVGRTRIDDLGLSPGHTRRSSSHAPRDRRCHAAGGRAVIPCVAQTVASGGCRAPVGRRNRD